MIGGPIAYPLMQISQWYTAYAGLFAMVLTLAATLCIPETLHFKGAPATEHAEQSPETSTTIETTYNHTLKLWQNTSRVMKSLVFEDKRLGLILISLMFTTIGTYSQYMLLQYISKRYGLSWAEVSLSSYKTQPANETLIIPQGQPFGISQTSRNTCRVPVDHAICQPSDRQSRCPCSGQGSLYRPHQSLLRYSVCCWVCPLT